MQKKLIIAVLITAIIAGGGGFFIGKSTSSQSNFSGANFVGFANMTDEQRQALRDNMPSNMTGDRAMTSRSGMTASSGEVTAKDNQSLTLKLADGSAKIVFYSASTTVSQFQASSVDDLSIGTSVMISGKTNDDGSITASMIQVRPQGETGFGFTQNR